MKHAMTIQTCFMPCPNKRLHYSGVQPITVTIIHVLHDCALKSGYTIQACNLHHNSFNMKTREHFKCLKKS